MPTSQQKEVALPEIHAQPTRPIDQLNQLRGEMTQMMDEFLRRPLARLASMAGDPALNLYRLDDRLILEAAVAGFTKADIKLQVTRDHVTIKGEKHAQDRHDSFHFFHRELRTHLLERTLRLPLEIDPKNVVAELQDGILKLTMPLVDPSTHEAVTVDLK